MLLTPHFVVQGVEVKRKYWDLLERAFWTATQGGLSIVTVEAFDLPAVWVPILAVALSATKSYVGTRVGSMKTASTLPASLDPASPTPGSDSH